MSTRLRSLYAPSSLWLALASGCAHAPGPPPAPSLAEYRLGREDVVAVEVWKEPGLSAKVPVRPDGKLSLPMIGEVAAEGRTADELRHEVTERLAPMVERPVVSVMVAEINAAKIYVLGEVAHPGAFAARTGVTVLQALALAGGTTEFADPRAVVVIRRGKDGQSARLKVDCRAILNGRSEALTLAPGDTVYVP